MAVPLSRRVIKIAGEEAYSLDVVAEDFGCCRRTIDNWRREGKLRCVKIGRHWYVPKKEAERIVRFGLTSKTLYKRKN